MIIKQLFEQYPNAKTIIKEWFLKEMIGSFENDTVPEEFKQAMLKTGINDEKLAILIETQPRVLFDVFDENEIYINITKGESNYFMWGYADDTGHYIKDGLVKSRKEAEHAAIEKAFELLEESVKIE